MQGRRPGRPKSATTDAREAKDVKVKQWVTEHPELKMNAKEQARAQALLESLEVGRRQILKDFKHGQSTPDDHAYRMASLDGTESTSDKSVSVYIKKLLAQDKEFKDKAKDFRHAGGIPAMEAAQKQASDLCLLNQDLLDKLIPAGRLTANGIAETIRREWEKRGTGGKRPSVRTLRRQIEIVGQGSRTKNFLEGL